MYAGFLNVTDPPWPTRVRHIELSQAFKEASDRSGLTLFRLKYEKLRLDQSEANASRQYDQRTALNLELKRKALQETAEVQRCQIVQSELAKKAYNEEKRQPGISPECQGYPSIPETPGELRIRRKLAQQQYLRQELERQMETMKVTSEERRKEEKLLGEIMLSGAEKVGKQRERNEEEKRRRIREELGRSWEKKDERRIGQFSLDTFPRSLEASPSPTLFSDLKDRSQPSLAVSSPLKASASPLLAASVHPLSHPIRLSSIKSTAERRKLAEKIKLHEDEKARRSLEKQIQKHYKTYSVDIPLPQGQSFDYHPGLLRGTLSSLKNGVGLGRTRSGEKRGVVQRGYRLKV